MTLTMIPTALAGVTVPRLPRNRTLDAIRTYGERENAAEYELAAQEDLLESIPVETVADHRSPRQVELMTDLIAQIRELDTETADKAQAYTERMTTAGKWTPGREGTASAWISRMIAKVTELRQVRRPAPTGQVQVADGRYAVEHQGTLKFFHVRNGKADSRWAGFTFLDVQASDDLHSIRNRATKAEILALIAADPQEALARYGRELGVCGRCGRTLTDEESRLAGIGPVCRDK